MKKMKKVLAYIIAVAMIVTLMPTMQGVSVKAQTKTARYEAENADISNARPVNAAVGSAASGGKAVPIRPTQCVIFTVSVEKAGEYTIPVRYATGNNINFAVIPVDFIVNGISQVNSDLNNTGSEGNTNGYKTFATQEVVLNLAAGENTIEIRNIAEGNADTTSIFANIDYIEITEEISDEETTTEDPSLYPNAEGRFEAEDALSFTQGSADNAASIVENANFSGGKYVSGMNTWPKDGRAYCTTKVTATVPGTYKMTIGYAGGEADHPCNIDVRINDGEWISTLAPVTAWDSVGTISLQIELTEGVNTIDVTGACNIWYSGMGWEWANLDYFELEKAEQDATTAEETTYGPTEAIGTVEAEEAEFIQGTVGSNPAFSGGKYVEGMNVNVNGDMSKAKYLSYRVIAERESNYKMHIAYATTSEDTKFGIQTNDNEWQIVHVQTTGGWATVGNRDVVVHLNEGENTIKITGSLDSGWIIFDKMEMEETTEEVTLDPQEIPENDQPEAGQVKKTGIELQQENLISFRGRNMTSNGAVTFDYTGSGFEFHYNGSGMVKAGITTTATETFAVDVDGVVTYVAHNSKTGNIILAQNLPEGNHTIKVYKTKEAMTGLAQLNYLIYDENATLTPMDYNYKFLVIGASSTCGNQMNSETGNENGYLAFPSVVSRAYNATWQQISVSGRGCVQGTLGESGWAFSQENQLADLYRYQSWFRDKEKRFDTASFVPDVIITNFNNDFGKSALEKGYSVDEVFEHTLEFISELRTTYPNAYIVMSYGNYPNYIANLDNPSSDLYNNYTIIEEYKKNIEAYKTTSGDNKIAFVTFPDLVNGQSGHANDEEHRYMSELLSAQISEFLNVENPLPLSHFEAENGTINGTSGKAVQITTWASKFSNNGYIEGLNTNLNGNVPAEDGSNVSYVSVPVTAWKTGIYAMKLATSAVGGTESYMRVNGGEWTKISIKDTGDWASVAVNTAFDAKLEQGENTVDVMGTTNGGYACVDRVDISFVKDAEEDTTSEVSPTTEDITTKENVTTDAESTTHENVTTIEKPTTPEITTTEELPTTTEEIPTTTPHSTSSSQQTTKKPVVLKNTSVKKVYTKKLASKKVKLTLKKVKGVTKYQIQISTTKKFKKVLIKKTVKKVKVTIKSKRLARKKKLYVRARIKGAKVWCKPKRIKVKK